MDIKWCQRRQESLHCQAEFQPIHQWWFYLGLIKLGPQRSVHRQEVESLFSSGSVTSCPTNPTEKRSSYKTFWQTILCPWIVCVQCLKLTTKTDRKSSIIKLHWVAPRSTVVLKLASIRGYYSSHWDVEKCWNSDTWFHCAYAISSWTIWRLFKIDTLEVKIEH